MSKANGQESSFRLINFRLINIIPHCFIFLIGNVLKSSKGLMGYVISGQVYRIIVSLAQVSDFKQVHDSFILLAAELVLTGAAVVIGELFIMLPSLKMDFAIRSSLAAHIYSVSEETRAKQSVAYWIGLFTRDVDTVGNGYKTQFGNILSSGISIAGGALLIWRYDKSLLLFCISCGLIYFSLVFVMRKKMAGIQSRFFNSLVNCCNLLAEIANGLFVLRFFNIKRNVFLEYDYSVKENSKLGREKAVIFTWAMSLRSIGYIVSYLGSLILGLILARNERILIADMFYIWPIGVGIAYNIQNIVFLFLNNQDVFVAMNRIREFLSAPIEKEGGKEIAVGDVVFSDVSFSYEGKKALANVSLSIKQGERIAIVGDNGSGKTTLLKVLIGFYQPDEGEIRIGGMPVQEASLASLRKLFSYCPQQPMMFDKSVKDNITMSNADISRENLNDAIRMADLESLISRLPHGLDTVIGENGAALSGGEKQRISLARCYMKDSAFLLLDEMTSSVDARTEERLLKKLIKANDKTIICVSHRLAVIRAMDRIIVMKDGEIVEDGSFDDLISKRGYLYQKAVLERDKRSREDDSILWDLHL